MVSACDPPASTGTCRASHRELGPDSLCVCPGGSSLFSPWEVGNLCSPGSALSAHCHLALLPEVTCMWEAEFMLRAAGTWGKADKDTEATPRHQL